MQRVHSRLNSVSLAALLCSTIGCSTVLDLKQASVDPDSAGAAGFNATGGTAGRGGTSNKGGASNKGGSSSKGGSSGGSTGGRSSTNLTCGDIVNVAPALVQSCVMGNSCDPLVPTHTLSFCITYDAADACVDNASTCGEVASCYKRTWESPSTCGTSEVGWRCDGNTAVNCNTERNWSVDCASLGGKCVLYAGSDTGTTWPCQIPNTTTCNAAAGDWKCNGSVQYTCLGGKYYGMDCGAVGLTCNEDTPGSAYCATSSIACSSPSTSSCQSNGVKLCGEAGYAFSYSCTRGGGTCLTDGTTGWYCPAPGCTPADENTCMESCGSGSLMNVCVGGAPYQIDCADYGFTTCVTYTDPSGGSDYVGCR